MRLLYLLAVVAVNGSLSIVHAIPTPGGTLSGKMQKAQTPPEQGSPHQNPAPPSRPPAVPMRYSQLGAVSQPPKKALPATPAPARGADLFESLLQQHPNIKTQCPEQIMKRKPGKYTPNRCFATSTGSAWLYTRPRGGTLCIPFESLDSLSYTKAEEFSAFKQESYCYEAKFGALDILATNKAIKQGSCRASRTFQHAAALERKLDAYACMNRNPAPVAWEFSEGGKTFCVPRGILGSILTTVKHEPASKSKQAILATMNKPSECFVETRDLTQKPGKTKTVVGFKPGQIAR